MKNRAKIRDASYSETVIFHEGQRCWYCAYDNGLITRTWKKSLKEDIVKAYIKKTTSNQYACVKVDGKEITVKHLMAKYFLYGYKKGMPVVCIDKNEYNCHPDNLELFTNRELGKETGRLAKSNHKIRVTAPDGKCLEYFSVRECAKALYCSYQTILDYMNNKTKNSILQDYIINRVEEQQCSKWL